jgi:hypothetical protein
VLRIRLSPLALRRELMSSVLDVAPMFQDSMVDVLRRHVAGATGAASNEWGVLML